MFDSLALPLNHLLDLFVIKIFVDFLFGEELVVLGDPVAALTYPVVLCVGADPAETDAAILAGRNEVRANLRRPDDLGIFFGLTLLELSQDFFVLTTLLVSLLFSTIL